MNAPSASAPAPPCSRPPRPGIVADLVRDRLGRDAELVEVTTEGDRSQAAGTPLSDAASTGVFVSALRDALLRGEVDVAVHSLKDLPTAAPEGIVLAAVPPREDPRDVVVARDGLTLGELPAGSRVGTGSPRRVAQLHALGLGLDVVGGSWERRHPDRQGPLRRVRRRAPRPRRVGPDRPARGGHRGAGPVADAARARPGCARRGVPCRRRPRRGDWRALDDRASRVTVEAERAVLATLEGGCSAPIGAMAELAEGEDGEELWIRAVALSPRRRAVGADVRDRRPDDAAGLGARLAKEMLADGAGDLEQTDARRETDKVQDA